MLGDTIICSSHNGTDVTTMSISIETISAKGIPGTFDSIGMKFVVSE